MRLFAAIDPPPVALEHLDRALHRRGRDLRWTPTDQWHVTLAFYGEVGQATAEELSVRLRRAAARTPTLALQIKGGGCFPRRPDAARVLWAGVDGDLDILARLAERGAAAGRRCGLALQRRAFIPHLTLARAKQPLDISDRLAELWQYDGPTWPGTELRLVAATLGAQVRHETLDDIALTGTNA
jgi:2'-5' RNA ligase